MKNYRFAVLLTVLLASTFVFVSAAPPFQDNDCVTNALPQTCTPGQQACFSGATGACRYTCDGADGTPGTWTRPGVDCGAGSTCTAEGIGGKCRNWGPIRIFPGAEPISPAMCFNP